MIVGEQVRLRLPDGETDHELLVKWRNDPGLKLHFYDDEPVSMDSHLRWWNAVKVDASQRFYMIEAKISDDVYKPIGTTSLLNIDWRNRTAEYGRLKIGEAIFLGRGFAYDAEVLLMRYAFDSLNLNRIWGHVLHYNERVLKLHAKVGFVEEGCLRQHIFKHGAYHDVVTIGLTAAEFRSRFPVEAQP